MMILKAKKRGSERGEGVGIFWLLGEGTRKSNSIPLIQYTKTAENSLQ